jgi:hypothetical protein
MLVVCCNVLAEPALMFRLRPWGRRTDTQSDISGLRLACTAFSRGQDALVPVAVPEAGIGELPVS